MQKAFNRLLATLSLIALLGTASSCASSRALEAELSVPNLYQKAYYAPFDQVWRAAQLAMGRYQMQVNNMDTGVIETVTVKGYDGWKPPHLAHKSSAGIQYKLTVVLVKGQYQGKPAVRATVKKNAEIQRDFFSDPQRIDSDGYEEKMILYRIDRELEIDRALQRAQEAMAQ